MGCNTNNNIGTSIFLWNFIFISIIFNNYIHALRNYGKYICRQCTVYRNILDSSRGITPSSSDARHFVVSICRLRFTRCPPIFGLIFCGFYFYGANWNRRYSRNKNPAEIKTYTVTLKCFLTKLCSLFDFSKINFSKIDSEVLASTCRALVNPHFLF